MTEVRAKDFAVLLVPVLAWFLTGCIRVNKKPDLLDAVYAHTVTEKEPIVKVSRLKSSPKVTVRLAIAEDLTRYHITELKVGKCKMDGPRTFRPVRQKMIEFEIECKKEDFEPGKPISWNLNREADWSDGYRVTSKANGFALVE